MKPINRTYKGSLAKLMDRLSFFIGAYEVIIELIRTRYIKKLEKEKKKLELQVKGLNKKVKQLYDQISGLEK